MAQTYMIEYIGAISVKKGKIYNSSDIITQFVGATCMKMKTEGVSVSVNGTDAFLTHFDDESYISIGHTFVFMQDCIVAIGKYMGLN